MSNYSSMVFCKNCGFVGELEVERGIKIEEAECPNCGCKGMLKREVKDCA